MTNYASLQFPVKVRRPRSRNGITATKVLYKLVYVRDGKAVEEIIQGSYGLCTTRKNQLHNDPKYKLGMLKIIPT